MENSNYEQGEDKDIVRYCKIKSTLKTLGDSEELDFDRKKSKMIPLLENDSFSKISIERKTREKN